METAQELNNKPADAKASGTKSGSCFKRMRDGLQQGIYKVINPFVYFLVRIGVTPNIVTAIGFLGSAVTAAMIFIFASEFASGDPAAYKWLMWGGIVNIAFMVFDMLDGQVARLGGMASTFGAFYDSVLDRYSELFICGAITLYFAITGSVLGVFVTLLATGGSLMVSYVRARGEALGTVAKVGLMQRPERVVLTALAMLAAGIVGVCSPESPAPGIILMSAMGVIAVLANLTALGRIAFCKKTL